MKLGNPKSSKTSESDTKLGRESIDGLLETTTPNTDPKPLNLVIESQHTDKQRETTLTVKAAVNEGRFTLIIAVDGFNGRD